MLKLTSVLFSGAILLLSTGLSSAGVLSNFNTTSSGWDSVGFNTGPAQYPNFSAVVTTSAATYNATGGNPGGYISKQDPDGYYQYFRAPSLFLGDDSTDLGGALSFDLIRLDALTTTLAALQIPVVGVTNGSTILVYTGATTAPVKTSWTSYSVPLSANGSWKVTDPTGAAATQAQLTAVFSSLTGLYIKLDYFQGNASNGTGEIIGLDNVALAGPTGSVPEPSTAGICLGGLMALLFAGWSARRGKIEIVN